MEDEEEEGEEDSDPDDSPEEAVEACSMCRRDVPRRQIMILMTRPVCLDCATLFFDEDDDEKKES
jgi:hypothetical protein